MFEKVSERFQNIFRTLRGQHRISEDNIQEALREIRKALLEADVNYTVVKDFIGQVKEKALGQEVLQSVSPGQMMTKIVYDAMVDTLSKDARDFPTGRSMQTVVMVGLQGCGKTTTCAKLARWYQEKQLRVMLVAADTQRPAAREQLRVLSTQVEASFFTLPEEKDPVKIALAARDEAQRDGNIQRLIVDTAGRLHIDATLMDELVHLTTALKPHEVLLTADAMTGQDAVKTGKAFSDALPLTGIILTKMDGDSRGGAAMSMAEVTSKPILFAGMGEKIAALELFYPDRMASRILGMGDIVTLVEKAQSAVDETAAKKMEAKFRKNNFDLEDFMTSIRQIRKMGSLSSVMQMIPGMPRVDPSQIDEKKLFVIEAMVHSMTPDERRKPAIINGSRKKRIARGSGRSVQEVNQLLQQFRQMQTMMKRMNKMMGRNKMPNMSLFQ